MAENTDNFITTQSKNCFYGNVSNILNNNGLKISEAELILISGMLNCSYLFSKNGLFFGIHSEMCTVGLKKIGYSIKKITEAKNIYNCLEQNRPIILSIKSNLLDYNNVYYETDRIHHIVVIKKINDQLLISDSFIPTIPSTVFKGYINCEKICVEIENGNAKGILIFCENDMPIDIADLCKKTLFCYIISNVENENNSVLQSLNNYSQLALMHMTQFFINDFLKEMTYDLKFSGAIARFDYLIELFNRYLPNISDICNSLADLKFGWELVVNKLVKCSLTLKEKYYKNIFETDIQILLSKEKDIYDYIIKTGTINTDCNNTLLYQDT